MFNTYEFSFAGESSLMYGLMVYDIGGTSQSNVSFGNTASIVETRLNNRIQPIHFGVNYHSKPLEFKLVFGSDRALDRYELENISFWLTGHQDYQWLSIDQPDLERVQFRCLITSLTPLAYGWLPVAFEATVRCDCPYAYGFPFEKSYQIKDGKFIGLNNSEKYNADDSAVIFRNESSVREYLKPMLTFKPASGVTTFKIINKSDNNREFSLGGMPAAELNIQVDNANGIIQEFNNGYNLYDGFNLNFFRLVHGDNVLEVIGDGVLTISGRFLYNVAG